jgi:hypothetical protein
MPTAPRIRRLPRTGRRLRRPLTVAAALASLAAACSGARAGTPSPSAVRSTPVAIDWNAPARPVEPSRFSGACPLGIHVIAHVPLSPDALVGSTFTLCYRGYCDHGRIRAPQRGYSPDYYTCSADGPTPSSLSPDCFVRPESQGSTFEATVMACSPGPRPNPDGDTVGLRLEHDGSRIVDHTRFVRYVDVYQHQDLAPPVLVRNATVEIWPSSDSGKTCESGECQARG